jgi:GntR family transcriptional regulator, transcriptional repressor for pyruvate dehydrogenase complex
VRTRSEFVTRAPRTPFPFERPLAVRTRGDQIADQLVTAIALGEFVEGQRLPSEREMATLVGVSRQSVRDAIHQLADAGYVEIRRGRSGGTFVAASWRPESLERVRRTLAPRWEEFEDLFELRQELEPMIARKAALRHDAEDADRLSDMAAAYRDAGDREGSRAADQALHAAISRAAHSAALETISGTLRRQISLGFQAEPYSIALRRRALEQHDALVAAILRRDEQTAGQVAQEHFSLTADAIRQLHERVEES